MSGGAVFSKSPDLSDIPAYVSAGSPQGLRRAMLKNNLRLKSFVNYYQITFADGRWFAWFFIGSDDLKRVGLDFENAATDNG